MEGESPLLKEGGSLPPNLPLSPRTSPKSTRLHMAKICFALYGAGALGGSFFVGLGGMVFLKRAAIALFLWEGRVRRRGGCRLCMTLFRMCPMLRLGGKFHRLKDMRFCITPEPLQLPCGCGRGRRRGRGREVRRGRKWRNDFRERRGVCRRQAPRGRTGDSPSWCFPRSPGV